MVLVFDAWFSTKRVRVADLATQPSSNLVMRALGSTSRATEFHAVNRLRVSILSLRILGATRKAFATSALPSMGQHGFKMLKVCGTQLFHPASPQVVPRGKGQTILIHILDPRQERKYWLLGETRSADQVSCIHVWSLKQVLLARHLTVPCAICPQTAASQHRFPALYPRREKQRVLFVVEIWPTVEDQCVEVSFVSLCNALGNALTLPSGACGITLLTAFIVLTMLAKDACVLFAILRPQVLDHFALDLVVVKRSAKTGRHLKTMVAACGSAALARSVGSMRPRRTAQAAKLRYLRYRLLIGLDLLNFCWATWMCKRRSCVCLWNHIGWPHGLLGIFRVAFAFYFQMNSFKL
eukprot:TRINITY_DN39190_c0_g1_i1.p1 TRINITY_DN39190_c0_g1~~TRINITY_DN39190_c0_g1_i1.p1  ORF type:complete len:353 (-),score=24.68 TRINITY_DN39190_c0_g1_i1:223-1281(-)